MRKLIHEYADEIVLVILLLAVFLIMIGCASELTEEERLERTHMNQAIDAENWALCELVYKRRGEWTLHMNHSHSKMRRIYPWMVESDLQVNNCRMILRDYWIPHE